MIAQTSADSDSLQATFGLPLVGAYSYFFIWSLHQATATLEPKLDGEATLKPDLKN